MKKLVLLLAVFILALSLVGCGGEEDLKYFCTGGAPLKLCTEDEYLANQVTLHDKIDELQGKIDAIDVVTTECDLIEVFVDARDGLENGYTFYVEDGLLYELKDGILTGDVFDNQDLIDDYCIELDTTTYDTWEEYLYNEYPDLRLWLHFNKGYEPKEDE